MKMHNKLDRDRMPEIIESILMRILDGNEYIEQLIIELDEELKK